MNVKQWANLTEDFGRSDFGKTPPRASKSQKWLITALICSFVLLAFAADLWPAKKLYFWFECCGVRAFNELDSIRPSLRYSFGGAGEEHDSLPFLVLLKLFQAVIPPRLLCLRVLSILATCVSLFFLYRLTTILFSRSIALVFVFLLVTSPVYLESMRAFGYQALSHMVVVIGCYLLAASLNGRKIYLKIAALVLLCLLSLSLYVVARVVVLLPIVYFGLYLKKDWRKLLLFLLLLAGLILILDFSLGDTTFNVGDFFLNPGLDSGKAWITPLGKINPPLIKRHLVRNLKPGFRYLANVKRTIFLHEHESSQLYHGAYIPFMVIGLLICLWRRKRGNVLVLLLFFLFFFLPMFSSNIRPRRVLFSLYPINLMVALGLWHVFSFLSRLRSSRAFQSKVAGFSVLFLAIVSGCSLYTFFSRVTKPYFNYSRSQLKAIGDLLLQKGPEIDFFSHTWPASQLIWGNPDFVDRVETLALFNKRTPDYGLLAFLRLSRAFEGNSLYLFTLSGRHKHFPERRAERLLKDLAWIKRYRSDQFPISSIPGTDFRYLSIPGEGELPPASNEMDQFDLLSQENVLVAVCSPKVLRKDTHRLIEPRPDSARHVYLRYSDLPVWVLVDFGQGKEKKVEIVAARLTFPAEVRFFKNAKLYGSHDGEKWYQVAPRPSPCFDRQEIVCKNGWRIWCFDTTERFRYYKLFLPGDRRRAGPQTQAAARLVMLQVRE